MNQKLDDCWTLVEYALWKFNALISVIGKGQTFL